MKASHGMGEGHVRKGIRADSRDAPEEGSDAGPSADLAEDYRESCIRSYQRKANQSFEDAKRLAQRDKSAAEQKISEALSAAAKSFWWAEDSPREERQHELLHKLGRWKRKQLGCQIAYDERTYSQQCPVAIAHKKMGLSVGFTGIRICSICRHDLSSDECPHLRDRSYWVRGGSDEKGPCRVCERTECGHRSDTLYRASVVAVVTENSNANLREVSLVRKPAQPEARLTSIPIDMRELADHFGSNFLPGVPLSCDQCLGDCIGFTEFDPGDGNSH